MSDPNSMVGRWCDLYAKGEQSLPFGDWLTYEKAVAFLDGPGFLEDRGCGLAWAKRYVQQAKYIGVDGSLSKYTDIVADLRFYRSNPDYILMRHVLEHNVEWKPVLENALASFKKKMALIIFTPFVDATREIARDNEYNVPDIAFKKEDLTSLFPCQWTEETVQTPTVYGTETIFYLTR